MPGAYAGVSPWTDPSSVEADFVLAEANAMVGGLRQRRRLAAAEDDPGVYLGASLSFWSSPWVVQQLPLRFSRIVTPPLQQLVWCGLVLAAVLACRAAASLVLSLAGRGLPAALEFPKPEAFVLLLMLPAVCEGVGSLFGTRLAAGSMPFSAALMTLALAVVPLLTLSLFLFVWAQAAAYASERHAYYLVPRGELDRRARDRVAPAAVRWHPLSLLGIGRGRWNLPTGAWHFSAAHGSGDRPDRLPRPTWLAGVLLPFSSVMDAAVGPPVVRVGADYELIPGVPRFNRGFLISHPTAAAARGSGRRKDKGAEEAEAAEVEVDLSVQGSVRSLPVAERRAVRRWVLLQYASLASFVAHSVAALVIVASMAASASAAEAFGGAATAWAAQAVLALRAASMTLVTIVPPCECPGRRAPGAARAGPRSLGSG